MQPNHMPDAPAPVPADAPPKQPLDREALRDVIDLSLWVGQMLIQHGADAQRVEETVHRLGTALGCDWMDILVSPNVIAVTASSGEEFRSKIRRVVRVGVNMDHIVRINALSRSVEQGEMDRHQVRTYLQQIDHTAPAYNRWLLVATTAVACAAFSRISGGDWVTFVVTLVAAGIAMVVRQELDKRRFNALLVITATAFVATVFSAGAMRLGWGSTPEAALLSSVLLLVPGVQLINAAQDVLNGHLLMGVARGFSGVLMSLAIALGILLALWLLAVRIP